MVVIGLQNIYLSLILLVWLIIFLFIQYYLYKRNYPHEIKTNLRDSKVSGLLSDTITNNMNIKTFASLDREYEGFNALVSEWRKITRTKWFRAMVIWTTTGLFTTLLEFMIFYVTIVFWKGGTISIGLFILLQIYLFRLLDQMRNIGNVFRYLYQSFSESAEMIEILETPHEVIDNTDMKLNIHEGKIDFRQVDFHYLAGKPIFQDLNLSIKPGEKVAIVGES